ncbi:molecular chaperone [Utexia brackfieldae]|uniref:fimbrial biogenesis chaperone n=1 Tax=Utexia brackfieldae TaxID=3074108 RepID=UPI00370D4717
MKKIILFFGFIFSMNCLANNIIVHGTRFIYAENEKEVTVQLNNTANRPAIAQVWLDNGDANESPDVIKTPFQITPPIARIESNGGQAIRIKLIDKTELATDRESLWWLNILDIPSITKNQNQEESSVLQLAIRSRFKFFYRPAGLGSREQAPQKLALKTHGRSLTVNNPTPFYLTLIQITTEDKTALLKDAMILAPQSEKIIKTKKPIKTGQTVVINNMNDYGTAIAIKKVVE